MDDRRGGGGEGSGVVVVGIAPMMGFVVCPPSRSLSWFTNR